ncbi:hypothetical protein HBB16_12650 [Pseudonocardia sp. MCCB 268]|nr:hypothetical protein [Pseudonocardia cytotoxica]
MILPSVKLHPLRDPRRAERGEMLVAGVVLYPGRPAIVVATWAMVVWRNRLRATWLRLPDAGEAGEPRWLLPILLLFVLNTGTIFFAATPTEASAPALGAADRPAGRKLPVAGASGPPVLEAVSTSVMLLMINVGAYLFSYFLTATQATLDLVAWVEAPAACRRWRSSW